MWRYSFFEPLFLPDSVRARRWWRYSAGRGDSVSSSRTASCGRRRIVDAVDATKVSARGPWLCRANINASGQGARIWSWS